MQTTAMPFGRPHQFANVYKQVGLESRVACASAHQLIQMLFDGFMEAITLAEAALEAGRMETKGQAIGQAVRILDEGLKAGLNLDAGGELAADLNDLYAYTAVRLTQANLRNDVALVRECKRLIAPLKEAWAEIGPRVDAGQAA